MIPLVVILGRPNVGKSTLFNRLLKKKKSLTHNLPGVTRDNIYGEVIHEKVKFALVDTGGLVLEGEDEFEKEILVQAEEALGDADLVLFVVDGKDGLTPQDKEVARLLRQANKNTLLVVNKVDGFEQEDLLISDFYGLGFPMVAVSAAHGYNVRFLLDQVVENLPFVQSKDNIQMEEQGLKLCVLGRPNVGKSSLVNELFGRKKQIVSSVPGTTRDCVDLVIEKNGRHYILIDTPGVRRKSNIEGSLERFSVLRALKTSKRSDIVFLMVDALEGICHQDKKLISFLQREHIPFIVLVNKIDLLKENELKRIKEEIAYELRFCSYVPVVFTSTVTRAGMGSLVPLAEKVWEKSGIRISTSELNRLLREVQHKHQPPIVRGKRLKFYYVTQTDVYPPEFVFFVNNPSLIKASYKRFLENKIRNLFNLEMVPLKIYFRGRS